MGTTYSSVGAIPHVYPSYPPACTQCPPSGQRNTEYGFIGLPSNATWCVPPRRSL